MNFKKFLAATCVVTAIGMAFVGCSGKNSNAAKKATESKGYNNDYFVTANWLADNLENKNIVILDARSEKAYNKEHIPGAINVAWQSLANMKGKAGDKGWGVALNKEELSKKLESLGIDKNTEVITYANKDGWGEDGRLTWELKTAGINSKMLDGGFDIWSKEGRVTTKDVPVVVSKTLNIEQINSNTTVTTENLYENMSKYTIVDARAKDEYDGATKFGEAVGGHIKGAISLPFNEVYNEDGTIKSEKELNEIFKKAGLTKEQEIVTYCTAGIRSAHLALILNMLGYNAKNYDASYYEWATTHPDLIVK
ncbi:TPA: sulfurtransferase [Clostridium perfringens]|uniref:sulfurtransferase n=1 Tax=Clostridium perfringens TaxID=1502 RepID=UPI001CAD653C|nr:sulfurtransferase [Clostridium perfringens]MDB2059988.1 sulfurtransferase [Clostridium perfringens]MDB2062954.1 sulfurtransferase [Clostridium perfringens]MDB2065353.1 sulfurtransferase [Clostridium perfringens]MDH5084484.1 Thiosulfate sulfurtransferase [Clostridium perfringens]MDK0899909.1 sulfurtransferase [Clostridium perfringens]